MRPCLAGETGRVGEARSSLTANSWRLTAASEASHGVGAGRLQLYQQLLISVARVMNRC